MLIREATVDDTAAIMTLHERSVRGLCSADYTSEQIDGWLSRSTLERYQQRLQFHRSFIAELDGEMVGYVRWNPGTNELCSIFVHPDYVRRGIATLLMKKAYQDVKTHGVQDLWLDASLTAVPFYEVEGWEVVESGMHGILECVRMIKRLDSEQE